MPEVAEHYGFKLNRSGFISCPFHNEKTPSCKVYNDRFYCFGCGVGGDIFEFVKLLLNCDALQAAKTLNADFACGADTEERRAYADNALIEQRRKKKAADEIFAEWEKDRFCALAKYLRLLKRWRIDYAPKSFEDSADNPLFIESLKKLDRVEYLLGVFTSGTEQDKREIYLSNRKEVNRIYDRMQKIEQFRASRHC